MTATAGQTSIASAHKRVRTCVACGKKLTKGSLIRVVRSPEGAVFLDKTGRASGRGAYVCSIECLKDACKGKRFERALKMKITSDDMNRLVAYATDEMSCSEVKE